MLGYLLNIAETRHKISKYETYVDMRFSEVGNSADVSAWTVPGIQPTVRVIFTWSDIVDTCLLAVGGDCLTLFHF